MARARRLQSDPLILFSALGFVLVFVAATLAFGDQARETYATVSGWLMDHFTWLYVGGVSATLVFLIVVFVSRYGNLRLLPEGFRLDRSGENDTLVDDRRTDQ